MNPVEAMTAVAGRWSGTNTLQNPITGRPEESPSTLAVTPVLGETFARIDSTCGYRGKPQEGSLLLGFDPQSGEGSGHRFDTWHMGRAVLACKGTATDGTIAVRGSYAAPLGPDWGWRIEITPGETLRITHTNIDAEGTEDLAADGIYSRS